MSYQIDWFVDAKVILMQYSGAITLQEIHEQDEILVSMLNGKPDVSVHLIVDATATRGMPSLSVYSSLKHTKHPALAWTIVSGNQTTFGAFAIKVIGKIVGTRFQIASNVDTALEMLQGLDDTLPDLKKIPYSLPETVTTLDSAPDA